MSQYTLTGYDASAHMEQMFVVTCSLKRLRSPRMMMRMDRRELSVRLAYPYLLVGAIYTGSLFAGTNIPNLLSSENAAGGYAIAEIFYQAFKIRYGSGVGGIIYRGIVVVAIFFCGMSSITSNSRMAYAFSRDGAMPLSKFWHQVNNQEVPVMQFGCQLS